VEADNGKDSALKQRKPWVKSAENIDLCAMMIHWRRFYWSGKQALQNE
jgi:hypothetical protein